MTCAYKPFPGSRRHRLLLFFYFLELSAARRGLFVSSASLLCWKVIIDGSTGHGLLIMSPHGCSAWALASYLQTGECINGFIMICGERFFKSNVMCIVCWVLWNCFYGQIWSTASRWQRFNLEGECSFQMVFMALQKLFTQPHTLCV